MKHAGAISDPPAPHRSWRWLVVYKSRAAFSKMAGSRYLKANLVNLLYAVIMIVMDVAVYSDNLEGLVYLLLAIIHCINAYMYLWVWRGEHQNIFSMFCLPDWLNGVCAVFYLGTGFCAPYMYNDEGAPTDIFVKVRRIELFLSILECVAVIGWIYQWYAGFLNDLRLRPRLSRGRGWTLDDPDLWANISLIIAAAYYILYNIIICVDNYTYYETSTLYFWGDFWYLVNAACYILCALRDCECFWFMPLSGQFPDFDKMAEECDVSDQRDYSSAHSSVGDASDQSTLESQPLTGPLIRPSRQRSGSDLSVPSLGGPDDDDDSVPLLTRTDSADRKRIR